jgi:hypothetical protein
VIGLLKSLLSHIVCWIRTAATEVINSVISAISDVVGVVLARLPNFPSVSLPTPIVDGENWLGYWFPVDWLLANLLVFLVVTLAWWGLSIPLRWAKATRGSQ